MYFPSTSSGLLTADAQIVSHEAKITGVILLPAAAASSVVLYNTASGAAVAGQEMVKLQAVANGESVNVTFNSPIHCNDGIWADVSGSAAAYIVLYTH